MAIRARLDFAPKLSSAPTIQAVWQNFSIAKQPEFI